jgi:hypothetical protein
MSGVQQSARGLRPLISDVFWMQPSKCKPETETLHADHKPLRGYYKGSPIVTVFFNGTVWTGECEVAPPFGCADTRLIANLGWVETSFTAYLGWADTKLMSFFLDGLTET